MSKNTNENFYNISKVGNFTKYAVKDFEKNIVNEKDYLEKIKNQLK